MTQTAKVKAKSVEKIRVLSLFDGLSGAQCALAKLGVFPEYYASEIDEYAMKITHKNFPATVQLGDVTKLNETNLPQNIDLLIGGSPCQDLSISNNAGAGLGGEKSRLFWEYVRILEIVKPKFFVLENVESMKTKDFIVITNTLGVEPVTLDAALVSAQRRKRYFWTNIPGVKKPSVVPSRIYPNNKIGLVIADILETDVERKQVNIDPARIIKTSYGVRFGQQQQRANSLGVKTSTLMASMWKTLPMIVKNDSPFSGLQGCQAMNEDVKYPPIDTKSESRPAKLVRQGKPQGQNAHTIDLKSDALMSSRCDSKSNIVIDNNSQTNRATAVVAKHPTLTADSLDRKTRIVNYSHEQDRAYSSDAKHAIIPASRTSSKTTDVFDDVRIERLTWTEIERLAGLPDGYTDLGDENKVEGRGRAIGNGFQIDIVAHLLSFMFSGLPPVERAGRNLRGEQNSLF